MKRVVCFLGLVFFATGCTSTQIPQYIQDKYPYKKEFYADYDKTLAAIKETLTEFGWEITKETDPAIFEHPSISDETKNKQILLFTQSRQTSMVVESRYTRLNVYVRFVSAQVTQVELRYLTINAVAFNNIYNYKNDRAIDRIFRRIQEHLVAVKLGT